MSLDKHRPSRRTGGASSMGRLAATALMLALGACKGGEGVVKGPSAAAPTAAPVSAPPAGVSGQLAEGAVAVPGEGHVGPVTCLAFSPDGRRLVSGAEDGAVLVWDAESGEVVARMAWPDGWRPKPVYACAFLSGDRVVAGGKDILVWDAMTGRAIEEFRFFGKRGDARALAVSPDGRRLLAGTDASALSEWDVETGEKSFHVDEYTSYSMSRGAVRTVGYRSDGLPFSVGRRAKSWVWDARNGRPPVQLGEAMSGAALAGGKMALGGWKSIAVVDEKGQSRTIEGHAGWVLSIAASPSGEEILAVDYPGRGRVWTVATGKARCTLDAPSFYSVAAWSPAGDRVATGGGDGHLRVADLAGCSEGGALSARTFGTARGSIGAAAAGSRIVLGNAQGRVSEWDLEKLRLVRSSAAHGGAVTALAALGDGRWVSGGADALLVIGGDPTTTGDEGGPRASTVKLAELDDLAEGLVVHPGGASVLAAGSWGLLEVALAGGKIARTWNLGGGLSSLVLEPGGGAVVAGDPQRGAMRIPLSAQGKSQAFVSALGVHPRAVAVLSDGRVAEGLRDGYLSLWTVGDWEAPKSVKLQPEVDGVGSALVAAGQHLWAGGPGGVLRRWTVSAGTSADVELKEGAAVTSLALAGTDLLVVGLGDGRAAVRRLPEGKLVGHLYAFQDGSGLTVLAGGAWFATPGDATRASFRDPASGKVTALDGSPASPTAITSPLVKVMADGSVSVYVTVSSPLGPPGVTLDGGWAVETTRPASSGGRGYQVTLQLTDAAGGKHTVRAIGPDGKAAEVSFEVPREGGATASQAATPDPSVTTVRRPLAVAPGADAGLGRVAAALVVDTRRCFEGVCGLDDSKELKGKLPGDSSAVEVTVDLAGPAEALQLTAIQPDAPGGGARPPAAAQHIRRAPGSGWAKGQTVTVPLRGLRTNVSGVVEVRSCSSSGATCGAAVRIAIPRLK